MSNKSRFFSICLIITVFLVCFVSFGCRTQNNAGFINPYDLVSAANSFDKTELMQEMQLSLTALGQVVLPTEENQ